MLLTNVAVAEQVAVNFPEQALLRRNDAPLERRLVCIYLAILVQCTDPPHRKDSRSERKASDIRSMSHLRGVS
jgi:exoribonuclease R